MPIHVKSEIAPLKRVMLHRPGAELEHLTPDTMDRLLFDDIPYLYGAQQEHDSFANLLRQNGIEVVYLKELAAEALRATPGLREVFLDEFVSYSMHVAYRGELKAYLSSIKDEDTLIAKTMAGVSFKEVDAPQKFRLPVMLGRQNEFISDPRPNLYFTRDPFAAIGDGIAINRMYSVTRCQETIYARYIFNYHPDFAGKTKLYTLGTENYSIEGGDILNLSAETIAIGISQRTMPEAIEHLAKAIFADEGATIRRILAVEIPNNRACMHLDTVLTQVDVNKFVVYPEMLNALRLFEITPAARGNLKIKSIGSDLRKALASFVQSDNVEFIYCGGSDRVAARREQWNDGSNTLCIAPGKVVAYGRNTVTNEIFRQSGLTVLTIPGSELARGRGGPRCMSMPFNRE